jgi:hypothetical protein
MKKDLVLERNDHNVTQIKKCSCILGEAQSAR